MKDSDHVMVYAEGAGRRSAATFIAPVAVLVVLVGGYFAVDWSGALGYLRDPDALRQAILSAGWWGPAAVVGLMTLAIILSPLPSAPIALAAGAVYGHALGTVYVLAGAELGALAAFGIARLAGRGAIERWLGRAGIMGLAGSQVTLIAIVFVTRLMPFVSFDAVSYAAGLTRLAFWRFALATFLGIAPASFLLAHFGGELASAEADRIGLVTLFLGLAVLVPLLLRLARRLHRR